MNRGSQASAGHERSGVSPMLVFTMCANVHNAVQCVTLSAGHDRRKGSPLHLAWWLMSVFTVHIALLNNV